MPTNDTSVPTAAHSDFSPRGAPLTGQHPRSRATAFVHRVASSAAAALLVTSLGMFAPASLLPRAAAATWTVDVTTRTEADVRAMWEQLKPVYTGSAVAVTPSVVAPYAPGDATSGFRTDGVRMLNFGRYLAGLPSDVTLDATRNLDGQYGAVLLAASTFSHTPPKPADMAQAFYDRGYAATSSSNIGWGYSDAASFEKSCLDDDDAGNIDRVGHRRRLLNPKMKSTGIGFASNRITTYSFDQSRADVVAYDGIAWPSAGMFPVEFASATSPWSITLNPAKYDWDTTRTGHTVTLRRQSDGRTWTFDASDTNANGEYFNAEFGNYGVLDLSASNPGAAGNAFIFRPNPADLAGGYKAGEQYDVTLSGGIFAEGTRTPVTVTYRTKFCALTGAATVFTPPTTPPTPPAPVSALMPVYRFYNVRTGSHFYTASPSKRDAVIAQWADVFSYEGAAYTVNTSNPANVVALYRFYNVSNGSHFYTASLDERNAVIAQWSATYAYEGPAYNVSGTATNSSPMYRFYNTRSGSHFYTISAEERDMVIAN